MKKTLIHTNPYLNDPKKRDALLRRSIISSTAIEGVQVFLRHDEKNKQQDEQELTSRKIRINKKQKI
jgi:hypothetical protein